MVSTESLRWVDGVPEVLVEQLLLDELAPEQATRVRSALSDKPERLKVLAADTRRTLERLPPSQVATEIRQRIAQRDETRGAWYQQAWVWAPVAVVAALLFFVLPSRSPTGSTPSVDLATEPTERIKGDEAPALQIHRATDKGPVAMQPGALAAQGDLLQITVQPKGAAHGVVLSVDGDGAVTLHYPAQVQASTELPKGAQLVVVPDAYELDDAPRFERFFLVTAQGPIDVQAVLEAARALTPESTLALPKQWHQTDFVLRKHP